MLQVRNFDAVDTVFSFVAAFIGYGTRLMQSAPKPRVHKMFTELLHGLTKDWGEEEASSDMLEDMKADI